MFNIKLITISLILFIFSISVYGGIGLTKEQCEKEYGKPVQKDESNATYKYYSYNKDGFDIEVEITRGICNDVCFNTEKSRKDYITEEEIKKIILKNCKGKLTKISENKLSTGLLVTRYRSGTFLIKVGPRYVSIVSNYFSSKK